VWQVTPSPFHDVHVPSPPLDTVVVDGASTLTVMVVVVVVVADKKPAAVVVGAWLPHADVQVDFELQ